MSIFFLNKNTSDEIELATDNQFNNVIMIKNIAVNQLKCRIQDLKIYHFGTDKQYNENQIILKGERVTYIIKNKDHEQVQKKKKGIFYPQDLEKMIESSKIIVIKSANEQNIQKSKDHSVWATTFSNQEKLKYLFNSTPNLLLLFATNRSFQLKGLARMESSPEPQPDKSFWSGVANIRLGGNFRIKWLRKKPLSLANVEKTLGANFKENIVKACNGQELEPAACKKLAYLFQTPTEPYYKQQAPRQIIEERPSTLNNLLSLGSYSFGSIPILPNQICLDTNVIQAQMNSSSSSQSSSSQQKQKKKKIKKNKKKRSKSHKEQKKRRSRKSSIESSSSEFRRHKEKRKKSKKGKKRHS